MCINDYNDGISREDGSVSGRPTEDMSSKFDIIVKMVTFLCYNNLRTTKKRLNPLQVHKSFL